MSDYTVNFPELREAGDTFGELHARADGQLATMASVPLTQPDFGRIPWLQTRVFEAYQEHTTECRDALQELTEALEATSDGLIGCADAYEDLEDALAEAIITFFEGVTQ